MNTPGKPAWGCAQCGTIFEDYPSNVCPECGEDDIWLGLLEEEGDLVCVNAHDRCYEMIECSYCERKIID